MAMSGNEITNICRPMSSTENKNISKPMNNTESKIGSRCLWMVLKVMVFANPTSSVKSKRYFFMGMDSTGIEKFFFFSKTYEYESKSNFNPLN